MTRLNAFIARHPVAAYFTMTFVLSWGGAFLAVGGAGGMRGTTPQSDPRFAYALIAMLVGPSASSILLTALLYGRRGLRELLGRLLTWRVRARWYGVALVLSPVLMAVTLFALSMTSPTFLPGIFSSDERASLLLVSLAVGASAGIFEELGWTGFAIPVMRRRYGVGTTGVIVGMSWSAWHLFPIVWSSAAAAGDLAMPVYLAAQVVGIFIGYLTAFRILMVWVYEHTESLFIAMLMHLSFTASLLILNPLALAGTSLQVYSFALAAAVWVVVGVITTQRISLGGHVRRRLAAVLSIAAAVGGAAHPASGQEKPSPVVELIVGRSSFIDEAWDHFETLGAGARVFLTPRLAIGPEVTLLLGAFDGLEASHLLVTGNMTFDFMRDDRARRVVPYFAAGGGYMRQRTLVGGGPGSTSIVPFTSSEGTVSAGLGARIAITSRVFIAPEFRLGWEPETRVALTVGMRTR